MSTSSKSEIKGFDRQYWDDNYYDPKSMDCIGNAKDHVRYLKALFTLEYIDISSIIDLGAGLGFLFKEFNKAFIPYKCCALEPSEYAFKKLEKKKLTYVDSTKLTLLNEDLNTWCATDRGKKASFDLGLCTSVIQYVPTSELKKILPILAKRVKYLYLTVPTDIELNRQVAELQFLDKYAIKRSREEYQKLLRPHFTFISSRLLESKSFFSEKTTSFTDLLYRY